MQWTQMMEELTDTQCFGQYNIIPLRLFVAGHNDKGTVFGFHFFLAFGRNCNSST